MYDTRAGAIPDPRSGAPGGLKGGWWPFWSASIVAVTGLVVVARALLAPQGSEGAFQGRKGLFDLLKLLVPMIVAVLLMPDGRLGFYLASGIYVAFFAAVMARYRPAWSLAAGVGIPAALFAVFEIAFRANLPKSFFYPGLPF